MDMMRLHTLTFTLPGTESGEDVNGFPIPGSDGEEISIPCRYVSGAGKGGVKTMKNQNNEEVIKKGRIRVDIGSIMPAPFTNLTVKEGDFIHFEGPALEIYTGGTLTGWRIDV